jgi:multicomponent Na+:H+ antiporter subunit C
MVLGLYCIVTKYNLIKSVIGLSILDYGVNLLIITIGFNPGGTAPIFTQGEITPASYFVDPIPQALTLTSIVIGACVTAMSLALVIKLEEQYGTIDTRQIRRLRG